MINEWSPQITVNFVRVKVASMAEMSGFWAASGIQCPQGGLVFWYQSGQEHASNHQFWIVSIYQTSKCSSVVQSGQQKKQFVHIFVCFL